MTKEESLIILGRNIKALRVGLGMSQEELAKKSGYASRSSINKIELGKRDVPRSSLVKIANALCAKPSDLLDCEPKKLVLSDEQEISFINRVKNLPPDRQKLFLKYLEMLESLDG